MYRVFRYTELPKYWPAASTIYVNVTPGIVEEYVTDNEGNPSLVNSKRSVQAFASTTNFPAVGRTDMLYVAKDTDLLYYWDGAAYVTLTSPAPNLVWGNLSGTITDQLDLVAYVTGQGYITSAALTGYVPYTGATADLNLGAYQVLANGATIGSLSTSNTSLSIISNGFSNQNGLIFTRGSSTFNIVNAGSLSVMRSSTTIFTFGSDLNSYALTNLAVGYGGSPTARLHVQGASAVSGSAFLVTNSTPTTILEISNNRNVSFASTNNFFISSYDTTINAANGVKLNDINFTGNVIFRNGMTNNFIRLSGDGTVTNSLTIYGSTHATSPNAFAFMGGNVGIGTTAPTAKLHISGAALSNLLQISNPASADFIVKSDATLTDYTGLYWGNDWKFLSKQSATLFISASNDIMFLNGYQSKATILSTGAMGVGIGASLQAMLHVVSTSATTGNCAVFQNSTPTTLLEIANAGETTFKGGQNVSMFKPLKLGNRGATSIGLLITDNSSSGSGVGYGANIWMNGNGRIHAGNSGSSFYNNAGSDIAFGRHATNTWGIYQGPLSTTLGHLALDTLLAANVGIGTSNPSQKLHVVGDILIGDYNNSTNLLRWANISNAGNSAFMGRTASAQFEINAGNVTEFRINTPGGADTQPLNFWGGGITTMSLYRNSRVRIGATSAANSYVNPSATLEVRGDSATTGNAFLVQNSTPTNLFTIDNTGKIGLRPTNFELWFGTISNHGYSVLKQVSGVVTYQAPNNSSTINLFGSIIGDYLTGAQVYGVNISNAVVTRTITGTYSLLRLGQYITPISGVSNTNYIQIDGAITQTGGANGITRGIYIAPTLTAAADFRGLEIITGNNAAHTLIKLSNNTRDVFCVKGDNKIGMFNATPTEQGTLGLATAMISGGGGTPIDDASTFDGYTVGQVVTQLRNMGILS